MRLKICLFTICLFTAMISHAQSVTNHTVEATGVYKSIDLSEELEIIQRLNSPDKQRRLLIDSVEHSANNFTPSLLYIISAVLFQQEEKDEAAYWFYVAQLRARYDTNRCADKTASPVRYNQMIGPPINQYAFSNLDNLERIVAKAINFVKANPENYDPRWINMEGMGAFTSSLGDKKEEKPLSLPKEQWPAIKAKTIEDFTQGFKEAIAAQRRKP